MVETFTDGRFGFNHRSSGDFFKIFFQFECHNRIFLIDLTTVFIQIGYSPEQARFTTTRITRHTHTFTRRDRQVNCFQIRHLQGCES